MKRTLPNALLASRSREPVREGEICSVRVDFAFANDITAPPAIRAFREMGADRVFDPQRCAILPDHFTPNKDMAAAQQAKEAREFAREQGLRYWEVGRVGVEHAFLPEQGLVLPGEVVVGADSHTCTGGALGAFATGLGSTDLAAAWALGETWFLVPPTLRVNVEGHPSPWVGGKDVALALLGRLGVQGARYKALEFAGEAFDTLTLDEHFTVANMAVECGAKVGVFVPNAKMLAYAEARKSRPFEPIFPDEGAFYEAVLEIDAGTLEPLVAAPPSPAAVRPAKTFADVTVDQVFIGSCTNGRLRDLELAAGLLAGKRVADHVRCIVIPASYEIFSEALKRGYMATFVEAGAVVCTPSCGPCLGGHLGILAAGERCLATSNHNFTGRMGHPESEIYLAGPLVAAATALTGRITDPREL